MSLLPRNELTEVGSAPLPPRQESSQGMFEFEMSSLQSENAKLKDTLARQQVELSRIETELESVRVERDLLRNKVSAADKLVTVRCCKNLTRLFTSPKFN